ncbi:MAG: protein-disulfide reductase DsbD N-terminal domain-containing protein, partial [Bacteroidia bacterium]|nr:protein-disulfide reductase DsbD N-terminal domain-containing protein [Bacteroidia bacterium]
MKKLLYFLLLITVFNTSLNGQILEPVKWSTTVEKISDSDFDLVIKATIDKGWHLYAQSIPDDGPIPTTFSFVQQDHTFQLIGNPTEEKGVEDFDKVFEMNIKYFENSATFKQRIRVLTDDNIKIIGTVEFMVCDDMRCLPPTEEEIVFSLQGKAGEKLEVTTDDDEKIISESETENAEDQVTAATKKEEKKSRGLLT